MTWSQSDAPVGDVFSSALVASLPVVVLLGLLAFFHVRAHVAALAGLASAWLVAVLVFRMPVALAVWGLPQMKRALDGLSIVRLAVPYLDKALLRVPPVVVKPEPEAAVFNLNWLSATGTGLLLAGIVSGLVLRLSVPTLLGLYGQTLLRVRTSLLTIAAMLALGYTTRQ